MGIPKYAAALRRLFPNAFQKIPPGNVTSLSLDFNGILHNTAQKVYAYGNQKDPVRQRLLKKQTPESIKTELFIAVGQAILNITRRVSPQSVLVIAVDGVAPWAKITQQRNRRYKSGKDQTKGQFDSNVFTPGTELMQELDQYLQRFLITQDNLRQLPPKIIYSPQSVPGEGEHKILEFFRDLQIPNTGNHVFHGMDADLILLALNMPQDQIFLWREEPGRGVDIINIDILRQGILNKMNTETAIQDFTVMSMLVGNDFLPRYPLIVNLQKYFETIFETYQDLQLSFLDEESKIIWSNFVKFLIELSSIEPDLIGDVLSAKLVTPMKPLEDAVRRLGGIRKDFRYDREQFHQNWYNYTLTPIQSQRLNQVLGLNTEEATPGQIEDMVMKYLQGIQWVITYYRLGPRYIDQEYTYPYYFAPLAGEMVRMVQDLVDSGRDYELDLLRRSMTVTPLEQLLSVLPPSSKKLLPASAHRLMGLNSPIYDLYPEDFTIDLTGKEAEWEGVALLPWVKFYRIQRTVEDSIPAAIRAGYQEGEDFKVENEMSTLKVPRRQFTPGGPRTPRGRGTAATPRGRGTDGPRTPRGRGTADSPRGRGMTDGSRGRGTSTRGRGMTDSPRTPRGRGTSTGPRTPRGKIVQGTRHQGGTVSNWMSGTNLM